MHGVNWAAAKDTYETLLPNIADTEELHNVLMEMIGELNASHTGVSGGGTLPGQPAPERVQTRYPGFDLDAGCVRVLTRSPTFIAKARRITITCASSPAIS